MSLCAILLCTDEACAEEIEAWGELISLDTLSCEGCGCALQAVAYSEETPVVARTVARWA